MSEVRRPSPLDVRTKPLPRILYVVSEDRYFLSHCLTVARAAQAAGFAIHVATYLTEEAAHIEAEGFTVHPVRFNHAKASPLRMLRSILALRRLYRDVEPAIVHHVTLRLALPGIVASAGFSLAAVHAVGGLVYRFKTTGANRPLRLGHRALLRRGLNRRRNIGLVQNEEDRDVLTSLGVKAEHITLIPGSGVDSDRFRPLPEPEGPVTVAFAGRMVADKGVRTLVQAHRILEESGIQSELLLAGTPDPGDPSSIPQIEVAGWGREAGITWLGHVADISTVWRRAHIAALPARGGEGVPKSLLEAAAFGRPLIATDIPRCRDIVIHEKTGLVVPPDDAGALASAILRLIRSPPQRVRFGVAARRLIDSRFAADLVAPATVGLYRSLL
ncbi:MAG: glycosyltransferase family 4 protein [Bradyrhizobiaceae bacterium]|nr:glycosyltransferase family 4 protein [Bradyrhizobiaceae bacterium]